MRVEALILRYFEAANPFPGVSPGLGEVMGPAYRPHKTIGEDIFGARSQTLVVNRSLHSFRDYIVTIIPL